MKITYRTADGRLQVEFEASSQQQVFRELAGFQEVFEAATKCGICSCVYLSFVVRDNAGGNFFELHCRGCAARKSFGVSKKPGLLFPHRKDKDDNPLPNNGWFKREGKDGGAT